MHSIKHALTALLVAAVLGVSTGCATLSGEGGDNAAAKTAVQVATIKVIDEQPSRAQRVVAIADRLDDLISDDATTSLDDVERRVRASIDWSGLDTAEKLVVNRLIDAVRLEIDTRLEADQLSADVLDERDELAVQQIIDWIRQAAQMSGAGAGADTS